MCISLSVCVCVCEGAFVFKLAFLATVEVKVNMTFRVRRKITRCINTRYNQHTVGLKKQQKVSM